MSERSREPRPHGYMLSSDCAVVNVRETCRGGTSFAELGLEGETKRRESPLACDADYPVVSQAIPA